MPSTPQLILPLAQRVPLTWDSFEIANNAACVAFLKSLADPKVTAQSAYLAGPSGAGKTHCLLATYAAVAEHRGVDSLQYLDGEQLMSALPIFDTLPARPITLIDNAHALKGPQAERALFGLIERVRHVQGSYVVAAPVALNRGAWQLADLESRLKAGLEFTLNELDEKSTKRAILLRFTSMGLRVSESVVDFILVHLPREKHRLFSLLETLNLAALAEQRRVTIPFIKAHLIGD